MCLRLYGTGVAIILNQAPVGQPQLQPIVGEQVVGVYSDQLRTEVGAQPVRQFTAVVAVSDLTWSAQPALPPPGVSRLYADVNGQLHYLLPSGTDRTIIDTGNLAANVATQPLGGDLYGTINNAHVGVLTGSHISIANNAPIWWNDSNHQIWSAGSSNAGMYFDEYSSFYWRNSSASNATVMQLATSPVVLTLNGDLHIARAGGTAGWAYFGNSLAQYFGFDGSSWQMIGGNATFYHDGSISSNGGAMDISGQSLSLTQGNNNVIYWHDGSHYLQYGTSGDTNMLYWTHNFQANQVIARAVMSVDQSGTNNGSGWNPGLQFGGGGEAIASQRQSGGNNQFGIDFWTASTKRLQITNGGNCIITQSGLWATVGTTNNNAWSFYCAGTAGGATGWQTGSSRRFKDNIASIPDALKIVTSDVHGYHYTMHPRNVRNNDGSEEPNPLPPFPAYGFIAEEWLGVADDVTTPDDEGPAGALDYGQITAILFEAFKDYMTITDTRLAKLETA
jgi:hypothetical protein